MIDESLRRVIDTETGEIGMFVPDAQGYRITSPEQREAIRKYYELKRLKTQSRGRNWVACYHEPIRGIMHRLKLNELGALIKLLPYMRFNKGGLLTKDGDNMSITEVAGVIKKSKRATQTIVNALVNEGVLEKVKPGKVVYYRVNDAYHSMGEVTPGVSFTKLYQVESRKILDKLTIQEAGLLYKITPFFHYENYYLCANPDEPEPREVRHLNHAELSLLIGEDIQTVHNNMKALIRHGIVMKLSAFGAVNYLVNPDIMFRRDSESEYTEQIRKQFAELRKTCEANDMHN